MVYGEFATDPCRSLFQRVTAMFSPAITDNANVNLVKLGERFVGVQLVEVVYDHHNGFGLICELEEDAVDHGLSVEGRRRALRACLRHRW